MNNEIPKYLQGVKPIDQRLQEPLPDIPYVKLYNQSGYDKPGDLDKWYVNGYGRGYAPRYVYDNQGYAVPNGAYTDVWTSRPTDLSLSEAIRTGVLKHQLENKEELAQKLAFDQMMSDEINSLLSK